MVNLRGTVAIVTGASRGIGRRVALGLSEAGATVYITGRTVKEGAELKDCQGRSTALRRRFANLEGKRSVCCVYPLGIPSVTFPSYLSS